MSNVPIRLLDDLGAELARVTEGHGRRSGGLLAAVHGHTVAVTLATVVLFAGAAYAVPVTRAAIDDIGGTFSSWMDGEDAHAPGRAVRPGDGAPPWVDEGRSRLIAEAGGVGLFVTRLNTEKRGVQMQFALGESVVGSNTLEGWRRTFDDHDVVFLGTPSLPGGAAIDSRARYPLMGVTSRRVTRVAVTYAAGPPTVVDGIDGGFVALVDSRRELRELVGFDAAGRELDRADVRAVGHGPPS